MIHQLTDENFSLEVRGNTKPIIIMFTGSWCQPCKQMKPTFEEMSSQFGGNVRFAEMDIETCQETVNELAIRSVPSLALFSDGILQEIYTGTMNKSDLRLWVNENIYSVP